MLGIRREMPWAGKARVALELASRRPERSLSASTVGRILSKGVKDDRVPASAVSVMWSACTPTCQSSRARARASSRSARTFEGLPKLLLLDLAHNRLATLPPAFHIPPSLSRFDLRGNHLATLPPSVFDNLPNLTRFYLQDNRLTTLPSGAFQNLQRLYVLWLHGNRLTALPPGLFGFQANAGYQSNRTLSGFLELTLHGNPGAPFALAFEPVVVSPTWRRPVQVAVRVAEGAPVSFEVALDSVGGQLEAESVKFAPGALFSEPVVVQPTGGSPIVVRVAGLPDEPGDTDCAAAIDAGGTCDYSAYTGIVHEAGPALVLNGAFDRPEFDEPAEIDLANVFLEFDDSAIPTFSVRTSDPAVATLELTDRLLKLTPAIAGTTTITVTATAHGRTATRTFSLTVPTEERRFMRGWRLMLLNDGEA